MGKAIVTSITRARVEELATKYVNLLAPTRLALLSRGLTVVNSPMIAGAQAFSDHSKRHLTIDIESAVYYIAHLNAEVSVPSLYLVWWQWDLLTNKVRARRKLDQEQQDEIEVELDTLCAAPLDVARSPCGRATSSGLLDR